MDSHLAIQSRNIRRALRQKRFTALTALYCHQRQARIWLLLIVLLLWIPRRGAQNLANVKLFPLVRTLSRNIT